MVRCNYCGADRQPEHVARCPKCGDVVCRECAGQKPETAVIDHFFKYPHDSISISSLVLRCSKDLTLLEKHNSDPYVESLRTLESFDWEHSEYTASGLHEDIPWNNATVAAAMRHIATRLVMDPNPLVSASVTMSCYLYLKGYSFIDYLKETEDHFGPELFSSEEIQDRVARHILAWDLNVEERNPKTEANGLAIARIFFKMQMDAQLEADE